MRALRGNGLVAGLAGLAALAAILSTAHAQGPRTTAPATVAPAPAAGAQAPAAGAQAPGASPPGFDLGQPGSGPVEITATNGIEWDRAHNRYIASGDAKAVRGDTSIQADRLIAYYRERQGQGTQIYRYEAVGNVHIATATQNAEAEQAIYDVDSGVMVLRGNNLRLTTPNEVLTARDSFEYWSERHLAVARGDATVITRDDRRIRADVLAVYMLAPGEQLPARPTPARAQRTGAAPPPLMPTPDDNNRVKRVEAFGNVFIAAPPSIARGDRGVYSAETRLATIIGNVKLTHCDNQLDGETAEINMDTGQSRIVPGAAGGGRVRALLMPGQNPQQQGQNPQPAQPAGQQASGQQASDQCRSGPAPTAPAAGGGGAPAGARRP
jgi:lipopolysaccharide export system protein LptA